MRRTQLGERVSSAKVGVGLPISEGSIQENSESGEAGSYPMQDLEEIAKIESVAPAPGHNN